jgi:hypothetical protein
MRLPPLYLGALTMSILKVLQLVCDYPGCHGAYVADHRDLASAVEQRAKARKEGWKRSGSRDICPLHTGVASPHEQ